jgi:hypothetical protein
MLVSGQLFQEKCQWNFDSRYPLRIWAISIMVRRGDRVFMKVEDIPAFINKAKHLIVKINAVIHNSDEPFTNELYNMLEPYSDNVYAVNSISDKAIQLPLGFRDHQYISHHVLNKVARDPEVPRTIKCLVNFLITTNPDLRKEAFDCFKDKPFCTVQDYITYDFAKSLAHSNPETMEKRSKFYNTLKTTKFAICPQGTGMDTHRVYECLLFGVVPIVTSSTLDHLYKNFPILIVRSWNEVTEELLDAYTTSSSTNSIINFHVPWE